MKTTHYRKKLIFEGSVLGELFTRFVNNPAFKGARLVNAQMMAQAGRDLDRSLS